MNNKTSEHLRISCVAYILVCSLELVIIMLQIVVGLLFRANRQCELAIVVCHFFYNHANSPLVIVAKMDRNPVFHKVGRADLRNACYRAHNTLKHGKRISGDISTPTIRKLNLKLKVVNLF